ncbi:MAG: hypothetical protein EPO08_21360 [Rhodospirillaceae bacterium]|nr:MAG: hypothetical protein EPO08_21360 [Rhodospirillaceae bacterium]
MGNFEKDYNSQLVLRCRAEGCDYEPVDTSVKEQERLFREHRRQMGEQVAPERPSPLERTQQELATARSHIDKLERALAGAMERNVTRNLRITELEHENRRLRLCWTSARKRQQMAFGAFWHMVYDQERRDEFERDQDKFHKFLWDELGNRNKAVFALRTTLRAAREEIRTLKAAKS